MLVWSVWHVCGAVTAILLLLLSSGINTFSVSAINEKWSLNLRHRPQNLDYEKRSHRELQIINSGSRRFTTNFTLVRANQRAGLQPSTIVDIANYTIGSVIDLNALPNITTIPAPPLSLYVQTSGNLFSNVTFTYTDDLTGLTTTFTDSNKNFALLGNTFANYTAVPYLMTPGLKSIIVEGIFQGALVARIQLNFTIIDSSLSTLDLRSFVLPDSFTNNVTTKVPTKAPTTAPTKAPTEAPTHKPSIETVISDPLENGSWVVTSENALNDTTKRHEGCFVMVPSPKNGTKVAVLLGGRDRRIPFIFNTTTKTWTSGVTPPWGNVLMHHMQCAVVQSSVYVIAAWTGVFPTESNLPNTYIYHPFNNSWTRRAAMPLDRRRGSTATVAIGDLIYVSHGNIGGHETSNFSTSYAWLDVYNTTSNSWKALSDGIIPRDHAGAAVMSDGTICVTGGRVGGDIGWPEVKETECYNPATDTWKLLPSSWGDIPEPRAGANYGTSCDGRLLIAGGELYSKNMATSSFHVLDVKSGWKQLPNMNFARHGSGLAVDCTCQSIMIASGANTAGGLVELTSVETYYYNKTYIGPQC